MELRAVSAERANRRKVAFVGRRDPRTYSAGGFVTYVEQFVASTWHEVFEDTGWRPSRAFVIGRDKLDAEAIRWLAEFNRLNSRK
jgi:hypothetical protein